MTAEEIWRKCGVRGYEVSNLGRVRSYWNGRWGITRKTPLILKPRPDAYGYPRACLMGQDFKVHQLVAAAFIGPCPDGYEVNHKNGVKTDNYLDNLEYVTHQRNMKHATDCGLNTPPRWQDRKRKLTDEEIREIRSCGGVQWRVALRYGISQGLVSLIRGGKSWASISDAKPVTEIAA